MSLTLVQRLNTLMWLAFSLLMALATDVVNILMANQYPWLMAPLGWSLLAYAIWLLLQSRCRTPMVRPLQIFIAINYGWSLLIVLLISTGQVIIAPMGIRIAMVMALFTAALGALLFRHYKLLMGKY